MRSRKIVLCFLLCIIMIQVQSSKVGDECTIRHTTLSGKCKAMSDCLPARLDFDLDGVQPTYCNLDFFDINHVFVCCQDIAEPQSPQTTPNQDETTKETEVENTNKRISQKKCEEYNRNATDFIEHVDTNISDDPLSGATAQLGEFPHIALIGFEENDSNETVFLCTAFLISPKFLIGPAHCNIDAIFRPQFIRLGEYDLDPTVVDNATPIDIPIKKMYSHPDYKPKLRYNDIMLIELEREAPISDFIRPACLWQQQDLGGFYQAVLSGWSLDHPNFKDEDRYKGLKKVVVYIYDNNDCNQELLSFRNRNWSGVASTQICTGDSKRLKDTCQGSTGSPIQVKICEGKCLNFVIGFTALSFGCGINVPGINTRISSYLDWIESVVWPEP